MLDPTGLETEGAVMACPTQYDEGVKFTVGAAGIGLSCMVTEPFMIIGVHTPSTASTVRTSPLAKFPEGTVSVNGPPGEVEGVPWGFPFMRT